MAPPLIGIGLACVSADARDGADLGAIDLVGYRHRLSNTDLPSGRATRLRNHLGDLPLILFTEDAQRPARRRGHAARRVRLLGVPFDPEN